MHSIRRRAVRRSFPRIVSMIALLTAPALAFTGPASAEILTFTDRPAWENVLGQPDFVETFAGVGAARVRRLFALARKQRKAIIFISEGVDYNLFDIFTGGDPSNFNFENFNMIQAETYDTISAASATMFLSTSQSETTSTGATWISRSRSDFPYQPHPMRPTRLRVSASCSA